jgi:hypothetical protein
VRMLGAALARQGISFWWEGDLWTGVWVKYRTSRGMGQAGGGTNMFGRFGRLKTARKPKPLLQNWGGGQRSRESGDCLVLHSIPGQYENFRFYSISFIYYVPRDAREYFSQSFF